MTHMHFRWNVPLPGPFSVGGPVDGRATGSAIIGLVRLMFYVGLWLPIMLLVWTVRLTWRLGVELVRAAAWAVRYVQARRGFGQKAVPIGTASHGMRRPGANPSNDGNARTEHILSPFLAGQLDAQRDRPRPPTYADPRDAEAYLEGWRQTAPRRPVPDVQGRR